MNRNDVFAAPRVALALMVGLLVAPASRSTALGLSPDPDGLTKSDLFCLWKGAGYGHEDSEQAAWFVRAPGGGTALIRWPSRRSFRRAAWTGPVPEGALGSAHTHPDTIDPRPSTTDQQVASHLGLPVVVVSRKGIWAALPDGTVESWAGFDWFRGGVETAASCAP